jgi:hypothetical protein
MTPRCPKRITKNEYRGISPGGEYIGDSLLYQEGGFKGLQGEGWGQRNPDWTDYNRTEVFVDY